MLIRAIHLKLEGRWDGSTKIWLPSPDMCLMHIRMMHDYRGCCWTSALSTYWFVEQKKGINNEEWRNKNSTWNEKHNGRFADWSAAAIILMLRSLLQMTYIICSLVLGNSLKCWEMRNSCLSLGSWMTFCNVYPFAIGMALVWKQLIHLLPLSE